MLSVRSPSIVIFKNTTALGFNLPKTTTDQSYFTNSFSSLDVTKLPIGLVLRFQTSPAPRASNFRRGRPPFWKDLSEFGEVGLERLLLIHMRDLTD
jgi:hypothetical protein